MSSFNMLYYLRIIDADAYIISVGECWVFLEQAFGKPAAISNPSLLEIEGDWCGVSECREVPCAVASHDVNVNSYMHPSHAVEE